MRDFGSISLISLGKEENTIVASDAQAKFVRRQYFHTICVLFRVGCGSEDGVYLVKRLEMTSIGGGVGWLVCAGFIFGQPRSPLAELPSCLLK